MQTLTTQDGLVLYQHRFISNGPPKARILIVHGYAEHSHRYNAFSTLLAHQGFEVIAYDQRGHGRSPGDRAYFERFQHLVDDLKMVVEQVSPDFIFGHSMGGAVLGSYLASHQSDLKGVIFSSPLIMVDNPPAKPLIWLSAITSTILPKGFVPAFIYKLEPGLISSIPEEAKAYAEDPFVYHGPLRNRTGYELDRMMNDHIKGVIPKIKTPFLALHGRADKITSPRGSEYLHDHAASTDKKLVFYEDCFHELLHDHCREAFIKEVLDWLNTHL